VVHCDLRSLLPATAWVDRITWRLGGDWLSPLLLQPLSKFLAPQQFDICYVDGGEYVSPAVMALLRRHARTLVSYSIDDPLGPRDGARFRALRKSLPLYDLNAVVRSENVDEGEALGARQMLRVYRSADERSHAPRPLSAQDHQRWDCDVLFLGTWFAERGPFLKELIARGVPLTIQGAHWHKAREWPVLKKHWRGGAIAGDDYARAIQCARVNLGLVSRENRDQHTTRSLEIPALGGLLCAERTAEHLGMYVEGFEALFWSDAKECAEMCGFALRDEETRRVIAAAGHQRVMRNGHYNETVLKTILDASLVCA
jgi:spore maturation protein CgeB